jgi:hypothetical protein
LKRATLFASAAVLATAAGLLTAVPAQAAVSLPAGCTADGDYAQASEVSSLSCTNLADGTDLRTYTGMTSLYIGPSGPTSPAATLTRLPSLPAGLVSLNVHANKINNFDSLAGLNNLQFLDVNGSTVTNLAAVATNKNLTYLSLTGPDYWGMNLSPLAQLPNLQSLTLWGFKTKTVNAVEGVWADGGFGRGLDGGYLLPTNSNVVDKTGKVIGKEYQFDAATGRVKYNVGSVQMQTVRQSLAPKIATLPKLTEYNLWIGRPLSVAKQAEWTHEKTNVLIVTGTLKVGSVLTARHKYGSGLREYADTFQWKRDGKAIPGATGKTYRLTSADLGRAISVTGTDTKDIFSFGAIKVIPYSQTVIATPKLLNSFAYTRPSFYFTGRAGRDLTARVKAVRIPAGTRVQYQWKRNGVAIRGAIWSTYRLTAADRGRVLTVSSVWSKAGYYNASGTSNGYRMFW